MATVFAHFSPGGTTRGYGSGLAGALGPVEELDLLPAAGRAGGRRLGADDRLVVAAPVYKGRLPQVGLLAGLVGEGTPAYAVVTYGNRAFEDALAELVDGLVARGFVVVGAAAVVAQHTYTALLAPGRPTAADAGELAGHVAAAFASRDAARDAAGHEAGRRAASEVPGNRPYKEVPTGRKVTPDVTAACTRCGDCAGECPVEAIPTAAPNTTDLARCIGCGRCLVVCPEDARVWGGDHAAVRAWLEGGFTARRENAYYGPFATGARFAREADASAVR